MLIISCNSALSYCSIVEVVVVEPATPSLRSINLWIFTKESTHIKRVLGTGEHVRDEQCHKEHDITDKDWGGFG